mmetsp:Transcript_24998/g.38815  ORF Transcript_24998/g.38815 Transcript_24998/m.38815 type:complete len:95 (+) Transcript_24998:810-1094(+)
MARLWFWYRYKFDGSLELIDDVLGYDETQTDSIAVELLRVLDETEEPEELVLVIVGYAYTRVDDGDLQVVAEGHIAQVVRLEVLNYFNSDCNGT